MVSKIKLKTLLGLIASKTALFLCEKILKGGTNFPGKVAIKLDKNILRTVSGGYKVILVTGTNGKTTTTSMINNILKESGHHVITNSSGANMLAGITSCFIKNYKFFSKRENSYAVIETDEANVKYITSVIDPEVITITNLFRDQLDRFGEVYTTLDKIMEGVKLVPNTKLLLNADEPLLGNLSVSNPSVFFGFTHNTDIKSVDINAEAKFCKHCQHEYNYNFVTYNHLGDYYCDNCSFKRPDINYSVDNIIEKTHSGTLFSINGTRVNLTQSGVYNIYNALCAFSVCRELGISSDICTASLQESKSSFGRQEIIDINGTQVKIFLVKNPAGYNEAINVLHLDTRKKTAAFLLNDKYADGRDISWTWDVKFEDLFDTYFDNIYCGGDRVYDMAVRLKVANLPLSPESVCENYDTLLENINKCQSEIFYIFATYTAMTSLRKYFHDKKLISDLWS